MNMASPVQNNLTALAQHKRQIPSFFVRLLWALKMQSVCKSQPSTICTASFISFGAIRHFTVHAGPKSVVAPAAGFSRQACPLKGPAPLCHQKKRVWIKPRLPAASLRLAALYAAISPFYFTSGSGRAASSGPILGRYRCCPVQTKRAARQIIAASSAGDGQKRPRFVKGRPFLLMPEAIAFASRKNAPDSITASKPALLVRSYPVSPCA